MIQNRAKIRTIAKESLKKQKIWKYAEDTQVNKAAVLRDDSNWPSFNGWA